MVSPDKRDELISIFTFWGLIVFLVVFFGWIGFDTMQYGKVQMFGPWWYIGGLILMAGLVLFRLVRNGWRWFSPIVLAITAGFVLCHGAHLLPGDVSAKSWLESSGQWLLFLSALAQVFGIGRGRSSRPGSIQTKRPGAYRGQD
jgi:hypothetical protein